MPILTLRRLAAVFPAALVLVACGLESAGGSDAPGADAGADASGLDARAQTDGRSPGDDGSGDASASDDAPASDDTSAGDDAPNLPDAPPPEACSAPTESCTDGVDNDCNGLVDCADPACGAFTCTAPAPAGWALVELAATSRPDCDVHFAGPKDVLEGMTAPAASCSCSCSVTASGSCVHGSLNVFYNATAPSTCPPLSFPLDAHDGACGGLPNGGFDSVVGGKASIAPLPYTAGTCSSAVVKSVSAPTFAGQGRSCAVQGALGGGCSAGQACAPAPSAAFGLCVSKAGDQTCPSSFPKKHLVGSGVNDTRSCTNCGACAMSGSCANAALTDFQDQNCDATQGTLAVTVDGQCDANNETTSAKYRAYKYSADVVNAQCTPATNAATGSASLTGVTTICCP